MGAKEDEARKQDFSVVPNYEKWENEDKPKHTKFELTIIDMSFFFSFILWKLSSTGMRLSRAVEFPSLKVFKTSG